MGQNASHSIRYTFSNRNWSLAMTAFLLRRRREGRTLRWIAKALAMPFEQVRRKAVELGLVLKSAYQARVPLARLDDEPVPLGPEREILTDGCRWISADVSDPDWRMCGHPTAEGNVWCAHHCRRVFWAVPGSMREAA